MLVCVDESGFERLPVRVRTGALRGQTPVLRVPYEHEHLTLISGITPEGRLYGQGSITACAAWTVFGFSGICCAISRAS